MKTENAESQDHSSDWLLAHFRDLAADSKRLFTLVHLTTTGIRVLTQLPRIGEVIRSESVSTRVLSLAEALSYDDGVLELAQREMNEGYPITYTQFIVDIWGLLEAGVRSLVSHWLQNEKDAMQCSAVQRLKIRVGDYERHSGPARYQFIVQMLEREEASSLKKGLDRFESLLTSVELGGVVPQKLKLALYELSQLRNCIVHNARRADRQLIESCSWLNFEKGAHIRLSIEQLDNYNRAVMDYSVLLLARTLEKRGESSAGTITNEVFSTWV